MHKLNELKEKIIIDKQKNNWILIFKAIQYLFYIFFLLRKLNQFR